MVLKNTVFLNERKSELSEVAFLEQEDATSLLGGSVFGDGLGSFGHGVLGELSGEDQADSGLDLAGAEGGLLVVAAQAAGLRSDLLEDIIDEGVHDSHGFAGDAGVGVHLLQHLEDVGGIALSAGLFALLAILGLSGLGGCGGLAFSFSSFAGHVFLKI